MSVEFNFNTAELIDGTEAAFKDVNRLLGVEFQKRITGNIWPWPRGQSPRDIVDLGQLRDSYTPIPMPPNAYEHSWDTEYSMAVHEGAVLKDGTKLPARDWTRRTFKEYDVDEAFAKLTAIELRNRTAGK